MKKSKLVILRGRPTSGKTTAYASLKKKKEMKNWVFIDHIFLKKMLGKEFGKKGLFALLKIVMPTRKNIVIEEMSREAVGKYLNSFIKKYKYDIIVFQFTVKTDTAYKRDVQRSKEIKYRPMGKRKINALHEMHDERFDKNGILIDTNKLGKGQVVNLIIKNLK